MAECQVRVLLPGDVEVRRMAEGFRILVGVLEGEHHQVAGSDPRTAGVEIDRGVAGQASTAVGARALEWAGTPKDLFDGLGRQAGVAPEGFPLRGMAEEQQDPAVDHRRGRAMTGEQQARGEMGDGVVAHRRVGRPGRQHVGDDVLPGGNVLPLDRGPQASPERLETGAGAGGVLHVHCVLGPAKEVGPVGLRDAEQLAHHEAGEGEGHRGMEAGRGAARLHAVEHLANDAIDPWPEAFHAAGGERPGQQPPHPDVVRTLGVGVAHRAPEQGGLGHADGMPRVGVGTAEARVGKEFLDELVAGDEPCRLAAGAGQPFDRAACNQDWEPGRDNGLLSEAGDRRGGRGHSGRYGSRNSLAGPCSASGRVPSPAWTSSASLSPYSPTCSAMVMAKHIWSTSSSPSRLSSHSTAAGARRERSGSPAHCLAVLEAVMLAAILARSSGVLDALTSDCMALIWFGRANWSMTLSSSGAAVSCWARALRISFRTSPTLLPRVVRPLSAISATHSSPSRAYTAV